ncbi:MAG TPA: hypothetical protein VGS21_10985, partial [Acidimicrobiales bacterium]|nr:hypothetical protein [Acidimicrobiales bacterium]
ISSLASSRSRALRSSFRPTYNMAVNLVRRHSKRAAYDLVDKSFAQFVTDVSLRKQLDAVTKLLTERGYLAGWKLTVSGERLATIYHDADLLICEAAVEGLFDGLDAPSLAALVSTFTHETRRGEAPPAVFQSARLFRRFEALQDLARDLRADERRLHLPITRDLDPGFTSIAAAWARGEDLATVLSPGSRRRSHTGEPTMTGGDFVRGMKNLIDLLKQLSTTLAGTPSGRVAGRAAEALLRGVVAAASAVYEGGDEEEDVLVALAAGGGPVPALEDPGSEPTSA